MGSPSISASAGGKPRSSGTASDSSTRLYAKAWSAPAQARSAGATPTSRAYVGSAQVAVPSTPHEERGLGNSYVQGTAALVFFDAGNRLRRLYRRHGARLIIPVHDAFVFEAPLDEDRRTWPS